MQGYLTLNDITCKNSAFQFALQDLICRTKCDSDTVEVEVTKDDLLKVTVNGVSAYTDFTRLIPANSKIISFRLEDQDLIIKIATGEEFRANIASIPVTVTSTVQTVGTNLVITINDAESVTDLTQAIKLGETTTELNSANNIYTYINEDGVEVSFIPVVISSLSNNIATLDSQNRIYVPDINRNIVKKIAGQTMPSGKLVYISNNEKVYKFNKDDLNLSDKAFGFTNHSATEDELVDIIIAGSCNQLGNLIPGKVYFASTNGDVTDIPVNQNIRQVVGVAETPTTLKINIQDSIIKTL